jgi:hypothetical protein
LEDLPKGQVRRLSQAEKLAVDREIGRMET